VRYKPGNVILLTLATFVLMDIIAVRPHDEGNFLISMGLFGALVSRAFLKDPQSVMVGLLGLALSIYVILLNQGVLNLGSGFWYVLFLLVALTYALWEKILGWLST
jgi:hypothetical protein